ncbi:hypothetical protein SORBI_3003G239750 [Sorghum bicolor]|uniref:Uncharacterized protein n=1 Tax=Sorghum bicolor TaxID=4558 RepID=A0A1W0VYP1_SORBI|nr:hypothetical protein SORBI_3003G239750 [Sorghum bicolor]
MHDRDLHLRWDYCWDSGTTTASYSTGTSGSAVRVIWNAKLTSEMPGSHNILHGIFISVQHPLDLASASDQHGQPTGEGTITYYLSSNFTSF